MSFLIGGVIGYLLGRYITRKQITGDDRFF